jgi:hypothetical protein
MSAVYLAKFFHRAPGDDDRELLLCPDGEPCLIGIKLPSGDHCFRDDYSDMAIAVYAFRREAEELRQQGYVETDHTRYTLRDLMPDPQPKSGWQRGLDDLMLSALGESLDAQAARITALDTPPVNREPLYLWLAAHHQNAVNARDPKALSLAQAAADALASRKAGQVPFYAWSIYPLELEGRVLELLARVQLANDDPASALDAIEQACEISEDLSKNVLRAEILCEFYPDRLEEAFDMAYRYGPYAFDNVTAHPLYADYEERRKKTKKTDKGWRWSKQKKPAGETEILDAERDLGRALPKDYRDFLAKRGKNELQLRFAEETTDLRFYAPSALKEQRDNLFNFITRAEGADEAEAYFRDEYGISLRDLVPVAEPANVSSCLVVHVGPGERHGSCFLWDHDGAWELEDPQPNFDAAIASITRGIEQRDKNMLRFLGIFLD